MTPVTVTMRAHTYFAGFSPQTGEPIVETHSCAECSGPRRTATFTSLAIA